MFWLFYAMIFACYLVRRQQYILNFLCVHLLINLDTSANHSLCVFLYGIHVIPQYIYIFSIDQKLLCRRIQFQSRLIFLDLVNVVMNARIS
jgi:hypothetical protein